MLDDNWHTYFNPLTRENKIENLPKKRGMPTVRQVTKSFPLNGKMHLGAGLPIPFRIPNLYSRSASLSYSHRTGETEIERSIRGRVALT